MENYVKLGCEINRLDTLGKVKIETENERIINFRKLVFITKETSH